MRRTTVAALALTLPTSAATAGVLTAGTAAADPASRATGTADRHRSGR